MRERIKGKTLIATDEGDDAHGVVIKLYGEETNGAISIIEHRSSRDFSYRHMYTRMTSGSTCSRGMHARVGDEVVRRHPVAG